MTRKRKSGTPVRADSTKCRLLSWNMLDNVAVNRDLEHVDIHSLITQNRSQCDGDAQNNTSDNITQSPAMSSKDVNNCEAEENIVDTSVESSIQVLINGCTFRVAIAMKPLVDSYKLGQVELILKSERTEHFRDLFESHECCLCVDLDTAQQALYFRADSGQTSAIFIVDTLDMPGECIDCLQLRAFELVYSDETRESAKLCLDVYMKRSALTKLRFHCDANRRTRTNIAIQRFMQHFYSIVTPAELEDVFRKKHDPDLLYEAVSNVRNNSSHRDLPQTNVQHVSLRPRLRQYQRNAVNWMLHKEKTNTNGSWPHELYTKVTLLDGNELFYNKFCGYLVKDLPPYTMSPPGGILADEMGLGKTVEVLACLLNHRRDILPQRQPIEVIVHPDCNVSEQSEYNEEGICENNSPSRDSENVCNVPQNDGHGYDTVVSQNCDIDAINNVSLSYEIECITDHSQTCDTTTDVLSMCEVEVVARDCEDATNSNIPTVCTELIDAATNNSKTSAEDIGTKGSLSFHEEASTISLTDSSTTCTSVSKSCQMDETNSEILDTQNCDTNTAGLSSILTKSAKSDENSFDNDVAACENQKLCEVFQCICGKKQAVNSTEKWAKVQCEKCGLWQHPSCVKYDLYDPMRGRYLCPHCHVAEPPIESGATLIISPQTIVHQWQEEIEKHVCEKSLKLLVYKGVSKDGFLQPQTLADFDIVITTYETLRKEIDYVDLPHSNSTNGRRLRHPKRFMAVPSPLIAVQWWRICLDEAQMVECVSTRTAEMALRLSAINRWCITGTPVQRNFDDLYGLLLFLGVHVYWVRFWWKHLLYLPYCHGNQDALEQVMSVVMWRTAKKDVLDQIGLPTQTEQIHWLTFSPVEEHFYRRQFHVCSTQILQKLAQWTDTSVRLSDIDRKVLNQLLSPLLRLRQACCHPQVVRGEFMSLQKATMTMSELLEQLTKKVRLECEEAQRRLVSSLNGLAGLHIIKGEFSEAVSLYRTVLMSVEEQRHVRTDPLQQLHTVCNLQYSLGQAEHVPPTLRDSQLDKLAIELREKYLSKTAAIITTAKDAYRFTQDALLELNTQFADGCDWWDDFIQWITCHNLDAMFMSKLQDELADNVNAFGQSIFYRLRDLRGLSYVLSDKLEQLESCHSSLVSSVLSLDPESLVCETAVCCLRPEEEPLKTCAFCTADEKFQEYESKLFSFVEKGVTENVDSGTAVLSDKRQGTWADSDTEKTLKVLVNFSRSFKGEQALWGYGALHIKIFESMKKEFKSLRSLWLALREHVSCLDELSMATTRIRLLLPGEELNDPPQSNVLQRHELDCHRLTLQADRTAAKSELNKKLGQLFYLQNLAKEDLKDGSNKEPCPICQKELASRWSVLQCGHCFCLDCIHVLLAEFSGIRRTVKCAICRQRTAHFDVSYVSLRGNGGVEGQVKVHGDNSSKIEGVVRCLLEIQSRDQNAKSLVFSSWPGVLDVLSTALTQNEISFRSLHAHNKFQENLSCFKNRPDIKVLLLPVHSGGKGLNLIEATHVLFMEPILNNAQELQAIGRVQRIGQTRETVIHRLLVRGSIEERLHELLQTTGHVCSDNTEHGALSIGDLKILFSEHTDLDSDVT